MTLPRFYLTTPAGVHYPLPDDAPRGEATDDQGRPCEVVEFAGGYPRRRVLVCPERTTSATFTVKVPGTVVLYALRDPDEASVKYPAAITPEQYEAFDDEHEDSPRYRYAPQRDEPTTTTETIDLSKYAPWPDDREPTERPELPEGARWEPAEMWAETLGIPSHDHLIPGRLVGFHAAAAAAIDALPGLVRGGLLSRPTRIERDAKGGGYAKGCEFRFFHEDGLTREVKQGRRKMQQPAWQTVRVDLYVGPDSVPGGSLPDAISNWQERMAQVLAQAPEPGVVCANCRGVGFVRR